MGVILTVAKEGPCQGVLPGVTCVDGTTKKEDCNDCHCSNGIWACTLKFCPPILDSKCPAGTVGVLPNCTPVLDSKCPPGTTGYLPNCTPILDSKCPP